MQRMDIFSDIAAHMANTDYVAKGSMFGAKCLKIGGKAFAMFHKDSMVFKLPPDSHPKMFELEGVAMFEPMPGRAMNGWINVPPIHQSQWERLSYEAMNYVKSIA